MEKEIELSAYHEAGHILLSYFVGYSCSQVLLNTNADADARTTLNYKSDLLLITALLNGKSSPEIYQELPNHLRSDTLQVANGLGLILVAGAVAESVFENRGTVSTTMAPALSGKDLQSIDEVDYLLGKVIMNHSKSFISDALSDVCNLFGVPQFNYTSAALAKAILAKADYFLDQQEIEVIIKDNGFLDFIPKF